ncbi:MAG TPA: C39 family peptidase [Patescibacteria group bacterium]|nr:C39 family peptidase [Patescibacteria group bacterium]
MVNKYFFSSFLASSLFVFGIVFCAVFTSFAQTTPAPTVDPSQAISSISECATHNITIKDCPDFLEGKLNDLSGQEKTLSQQIAVMNGQIQLTQARIYATEQQISNLTLDIDTANQKVNTIQSSLDGLTKVLLNRVVATYEVGTIQPLQMLLTSSDVTDFLKRLNYLKIAQAHDKRVVFDAVQAKNDYQNQKNIYEDEKKQVEALKVQLDAYNTQLDQEKADKQRLLTATQGSEQTYQNLLDEARAELAGFASFVTAAGGGLTTFGTGSNGWYYTQRDPQWGNMLLPGSSSSVFTAGCAVTSVAMVCKSYGQNITPATLVANSNYFIYGDLWNWAFSCSGKTTDWIGSSKDAVKSYVNNGTPVILRLISPSISGLHFVVAWKWDGSDFIIHDPYYGPDKRFSDRYSWSQVTTAIAIH